MKFSLIIITMLWLFSYITVLYLSSNFVGMAWRSLVFNKSVVKQRDDCWKTGHSIHQKLLFFAHSGNLYLIWAIKWYFANGHNRYITYFRSILRVVLPRVRPVNVNLQGIIRKVSDVSRRMIREWLSGIREINWLYIRGLKELSQKQWKAISANYGITRPTLNWPRRRE